MPTTLTLSYPVVDDSFESLTQLEPIVEETEPTEPEITYESQPAIDNAPDNVETNELIDEKRAEYTQWILYGVLAVVNLLIILVIYLLYRKLFGSKVKLEDDSELEADDDPQKSTAKSTQQAPVFEEPPMDEMVIDELDETDIDLAEEQAIDADVDLDVNKLEDADTDTNNSFDDDPEFSLDDFAPDELDDDQSK